MATVAELREELNRRGVKYAAKARKADLEALLVGSTSVEPKASSSPFRVLGKIGNADRRRSIRGKIMRVLSGQEKPSKVRRLLAAVERIAKREGVNVNAVELAAAVADVRAAA